MSVQERCTATAAVKVKRAQLQHRRKQRRAHEEGLQAAEAAAAAAQAALGQARRVAEEQKTSVCASRAGSRDFLAPCAALRPGLCWKSYLGYLGWSEVGHIVGMFCWRQSA